MNRYCCVSDWPGVQARLYRRSDRIPARKFHRPAMTDPTTPHLHARILLQQVQHGDLDAAIEAGLMQWSPQPDDGLDDHQRALLDAACQRLRTAWAARTRFRARQARLQRSMHERNARRVPAAAMPSPSSRPATEPTALPAAAATILARVLAHAGAHSI